METVALVPAAGQSQRMLTNKLALPWGDATVLDAVLAVLKSSNVDRVAVIARRTDHFVLRCCALQQVQCVLLNDPTPDMLATVVEGIRRIRQSSSERNHTWALAPADMPWLKPVIVNELLVDQARHLAAAVVSTWRGKRGHPLVFTDELAEVLVNWRLPGGIRQILHTFPPREIAAADDSVMGSMNTPAEWLAQHQKYFPEVAVSAKVTELNWTQDAFG